MHPARSAAGILKTARHPSDDAIPRFPQSPQSAFSRGCQGIQKARKSLILFGSSGRTRIYNLSVKSNQPGSCRCNAARNSISSLEAKCKRWSTRTFSDIERTTGKTRSPFGAQLDQILDQVLLNRVFYAAWFCKPDRGQNGYGLRSRRSALG
jgi:hypothetical protein